MTSLDRGRRPGPLTRRRFLQLCAVSTSGLALSVACGQQTPAPAKPAESKPADAAKPADPPTAIPTIAAAVAPQTAATVAPTQAAPAAKPAAAASSGTVNVIQQLPITT